MMKKNKGENIMVPQSSMEDEFESIIRQFCGDSDGTVGELEKKLNLRVRNYDKREEPMGINDAKRILKELLATAASKSLAIGSEFNAKLKKKNLYKEQFRKIEEIDELTIVAGVKFQRMVEAEEKYLELKRRYKNLYKQTFEDSLTEQEKAEDEEKISRFWEMGEDLSKYSKYFDKSESDED